MNWATAKASLVQTVKKDKAIVTDCRPQIKAETVIQAELELDTTFDYFIGFLKNFAGQFHNFWRTLDETIDENGQKQWRRLYAAGNMKVHPKVGNRRRVTICNHVVNVGNEDIEIAIGPETEAIGCIVEELARERLQVAFYCRADWLEDLFQRLLNEVDHRWPQHGEEQPVFKKPSHRRNLEGFSSQGDEQIAIVEEFLDQNNNAHIGTAQPSSKEIHCALLYAYPQKGELEMMVKFNLNENLYQIVNEGNTREIIFGLINWAESRSRMNDLIRAAHDYNPSNNELMDMARRMGVIDSSSN